MHTLLTQSQLHVIIIGSPPTPPMVQKKRCALERLFEVDQDEVLLDNTASLDCIYKAVRVPEVILRPPPVFQVTQVPPQKGMRGRKRGEVRKCQKCEADDVYCREMCVKCYGKNMRETRKSRLTEAQPVEG
jgi:hypothetical protein